MFSMRLTGDLSPIIAQLDAWAAIDYTPLAEEIRTILVEENAAAREAGLDKDGDPFVPLRGGRALTPGEIRRRGGSGPPLAPRGSASRVVSGFVVEVIPLGDNAILVRGSWPDFPEIQFHIDGAGHNPIRDPAGITPAAQDRIAAAVEGFLEGAFAWV
jgi:hypothetical protein